MRVRIRSGWRISGLLVLLTGLASVSGCGGGGEGGSGAGSSARAGGGGKRLLLITNSESDWWAAVEKGMRDAGAALGADVEMKRNNESSAQGQIRLLEDALSLPDVAGVAVSVFEKDAPGILDAMAKLRAQGKIVIAMDSDVAPERSEVRDYYIGTNNREAGRIAGAAARALRPGGGRVAVFVGTAAAANAVERREGFFEGAGEGFVQGEVFEDQGQSNRAQENVVNAMIKDRGTDREPGVLLGLWSYNGPAIAAEANRDAEFRKRTTLVTFDLDERLTPSLERGEIDATVCQDPYQIGYDSTRALHALTTGDAGTIEEMFPGGTRTRNTPVRVIVPRGDSPVRGENVWDVERMKAWLAEKGLKSS